MSGSVEGRRPVIEALRAGVPIKRILISEGVRTDRAIEEILERAASAGITVQRRPARELDQIGGSRAHQGVVALASPFEYASLASVIASVEDSDRALLVALDHVTDAGNLGAVARSAEAAGASAIVIEKRRSASVGPGAIKSSAGALAHIPVASVVNLARTLATLKEAGFWVIGASEKADADFWDSPLDGRVVLVLGAEGTGLSRLVTEACDALVRLPMRGAVGSLNVAQTATVLAYEWVRRGHGG